MEKIRVQQNYLDCLRVHPCVHMNVFRTRSCYLTVLFLLVKWSFLCVCAGFWRLLSLQASCCGEEGCDGPQRDAYHTTKGAKGKTGISHTIILFHIGKKRSKDKLDYTQCVITHISQKKEDFSTSDKLSISVCFSIHSSPSICSYSLCPWYQIPINVK